MSLSGLFGALSGMDGMTACSVSMMCRLLPTVASLLLWTLLEVKRTCREHRERAELTKMTECGHRRNEIPQRGGPAYSWI